MRLFDNPLSGNCYKVRLLLAQLDRPYDRIEVDVLNRERRAEQLGGRGPIGRVPVLELDDGRVLAESDAILWYLADGTPLLVDDPFGRATTLQWLCFEQNQHEPGIAVARYIDGLLGAPESRRAALEDARVRGAAALDVMERHLAGREWFVGERYGIADIALFAYTHVAEEGGIRLAGRPAVARWLDAVRATPGWVPMLAGGAGEAGR